MYNGRHKLPATLFIVCIIALLGFKDTGIFVREYAAPANQEEVKFNKGEKVTIVQEAKDSFIVAKHEENHQVPKETLIRTKKQGQKYKTIKTTSLLDKPNGNPIRFLSKEEIVQALKIESDYGIFETDDGKKGYIKLENLENIIEDTINFGISKVSKVIKEDNNLYTLIKGERVAIKNFIDNKYIVLDNEGNEFKIDEQDIEIRRTRDKATRGRVSTRVNSINNVVKGAYDALGKPYVSADIGRVGYDCSGLTYSIYLNKLGIELPRSSSAQANAGKTISKEELIPGDLIFFNTSGRGISHVGVYIGDNNMIHASTSQRKVIVANINSDYYRQRYVTSKRIIH